MEPIIYKKDVLPIPLYKEGALPPTRLIFDIETLSDPESASMLPEPSAPATYKDPVKIEQWKREKREELIEKAALDPDAGTITAISMEFYPSGAQSVIMVGDEGVATENDLLHVFWENFEKARGRCVGYNILSFDLPYLLRRSFALGVKPNIIPNLAKFQIDPVTDLYGILYGWQPGKGLKWVAKRYGIHVPAEGVDGSMVATLPKEELRKYALSDLVITKALYLKMNGVYFKHG